MKFATKRLIGASAVIALVGSLASCCTSRDQFAVSEPLFIKRELLSRSWELADGALVKGLSLTNFTLQTKEFAVVSYGKPDDGRPLYLDFYTVHWPEGPDRAGYLLVGRDAQGGYVKNIEASVSSVPSFRITRRISERTEINYGLRFINGRIEHDLTGNFEYETKD